MARSIAVVALLAAVAATQVLAAPGTVGDVGEKCKNRTNPPHLFDFVKFTLHSIGAHCRVKPCDNLPKAQTYPHLPLTIKSLTTMLANGSDAPKSCMDLSFNKEDLDSIKPALMKYWPSFDSNVQDEDLWKQQAEEYGSCILCQGGAKSNGVIYLDVCVKSFNDFGVSKLLADANITQSFEKPIALDRLNEAFRKSKLDLADKVSFHCEGQHNKVDILQEISVCMDGETSEPTKCPQHKKTCNTPEVWYLGNLYTGAAQYMGANLIVVLLSVLLVCFVSNGHQ